MSHVGIKFTTYRHSLALPLQPPQKGCSSSTAIQVALLLITDNAVRVTAVYYCGRSWPAAYINFNQNIHQIQVLTKPLCRTQAIFYSLPKNEWGTKYHGLTYSAK